MLKRTSFRAKENFKEREIELPGNLKLSGCGVGRLLGLFQVCNVVRSVVIF